MKNRIINGMDPDIGRSDLLMTRSGNIYNIYINILLYKMFFYNRNPLRYMISSLKCFFIEKILIFCLLLLIEMSNYLVMA